MTRLAVSVEGRTEEEFVKRILADHLRTRHVEATPIVLGRARGVSHGGNVSAGRLVSDMANLYHSFDAVTSLVDFYGFRDKGDRAVEDLEAYLLGEIAGRVGRLWDADRAFPYVQRHEFEGLLFADVEMFAALVDMPAHGVTALAAIRARFPTPEDINDHPETAPSKRIADVIPRYRKVLHGSMMAERIGLGAIRAACPRFHAWVTRLEFLGG